MGRGQIVLQNSQGLVVRTYTVRSPQLHLVLRHDNRRVEGHGDLDALDAKNVKYKVLASVDPETLRKSPKRITGYGVLSYVDEVEKYSPSVHLEKESDEEVRKAFGWSTVAHLGVVGLMLLVTALVNWIFPKPQVSQVVTIPVEQVLEQQKETPKTVEAAKQKVVQKEMVQPVRAKNVKQSKRNIVKTNSHAKTNTRSQVGAAGLSDGPGVLGVLGAADRKATGRGGYNVANAKSSGGFGAAKHGGGYGGHGAGGINRAIFGSGMIAGNPGPGSNAVGAGGYGTKGVGGGGRSGYGRLNMIGGANGYFQPLESEAEISGGLDQDQIAEVIRRHMGEVINCYEQALQRSPHLSGRMNTRFVIGPSGSVTTAGVSHSSLKAANVESCVIGRLRSWKFPRPVGNVNVKVSYPFAFRRVGQG